MSDTETEAAPDLTPDQAAELRAAARVVIEAEGLAIAGAAREAGIAYSTFAGFMAGTYAGRWDRVCGKVKLWLQAREERKKLRAKAPTAPVFVLTPGAEDFMACFAHAQHMPDFVVITGGAGVGKTTAACAYTRGNANVIKLTAEPCFVTPRALLEELSRALNLHEKGSVARVSRAIVQKLRGTPWLIIIDEAQHLPSPVLDQLRTIHDLAEVGIALVGNDAVFARLGGVTRQAQFAQLYSRVGMRTNRVKADPRDVDALITAWGVMGDPERKLLKVIAAKPGALRGMTKTLRLAHMLAATEGGPVVRGHIEMAFQQLGNTSIDRGA
jgi:hypothetical protein